jgi:pimeloyl-ACP methyl ester carboxylesterase
LTVERPRLLLVPMLTELEWGIKPLLESWAEVASYDAPGVGNVPPAEDPGSEATAQRGLEEVDRRGWDTFIVVADEFGVAAASHLAVAAGDRVRGIALGHARVSNDVGGPRPALNSEVLNGIQRLLRTDPRMFVRQLFKMTGGEATEGGYGEGLVEEWLRRVPMEVAAPFYDAREEEGAAMGERLARLKVPMLLAQHKGCLMFTEEGFDDSVAALPDARVFRCNEKPSTSAEFVPVLREFCGTLSAARA